MKTIIIVLLLSLSMDSTLCADNSATTIQKTIKNSLTFRIRDELETLDWNSAHTMVEASILMNIMEGLMTFTPDGGVATALAQSWRKSQDGRVYTFQIRQGVLWTDHKELKAKDFVYSWKRLLSPLLHSPYAYLLFDIEGAETYHQGLLDDFSKVGIKAIDDYTFEVRLSQKVTNWIFIPAFWSTFPLRQDAVETNHNRWAVPGRIVTLGPFKLISRDMNSSIILEANPDYYGTHGNLTHVTALVLKEDQTAIQLYESGGIDILTDLVAVDLKKIVSRSDLHFFPQYKTAYLGFNTTRYPFTNVKLRRAIAMAIDKNKIEAILAGPQQPATTFVPPGLLGYSLKSGLPYQPSTALLELKKSGINLNRPISIDYLLPNWDKLMIVGKLIQSDLKKNLGINVQLHPLDFQAYLTQLKLHSFPIFNYLWTADYSDPDNFMALFIGSSGNNNTTWNNSEFDGLVLQGKQTEDKAQRVTLYAKMQKILLEDEAVIVPLYYEPNAVLLQPHVKKFTLNPMDYLYLKDVRVEKK